MMKWLTRVFNILLYGVVLFILIAAIGSAITKKPMLMTAVRSNSMYPLLKRGDIIFATNISSKSPIKIGDIVIFRTEEGMMASQGWIVHRIIGGDAKQGYITKGDANLQSDQQSYQSVPIKRQWISNRLITLGNRPLKLALLGYLPLWMEQFQQASYALPVIAVILSIIILISEFTGQKKKIRKEGKMNLSLIYFFSGLTLSIMLGASTLATSEHFNLPYEVSETSKGVIMGSDVGILKVGDTAEQSLLQLNNKGFLPIMVAINSNNPQISFSHPKLSLKPGQKIDVQMKVSAVKPGKYSSRIHVGMFYPLLPRDIVYALAAKSYWLALIVISLIPGLPLMLYPIIDPNLRKKTIKEIHRAIRRMKSALDYSF